MELSLAHAVGNAVEAAYARSDLFERRSGLMDQWAGERLRMYRVPRRRRRSLVDDDGSSLAGGIRLLADIPRPAPRITPEPNEATRMARKFRELRKHGRVELRTHRKTGISS